MLEFALLLLLAAGGLAVLTRRWQQRDLLALPSVSDSGERVISTIAEGGLYSLSTPAEAPRRTAFRDLHLTTDGLAFTDIRSGQSLSILFSDIQWVSAVDSPPDAIPALSLHLEHERRWLILWLQMPEADLLLLVRVLNRVVSPARSNLGRMAQQPQGLISARTVSETLQGATETGAEVQLYLLPHMLVVLQADQVQAKLDLSSIRRVLAVERVSGRLDPVLHRGLPDGIIRLYSRHETASFALGQYRELAQEISFLARCPLEYITQLDKTEK